MPVFNQSIVELSAQLGQLLLENNWTVTSAESCTGGLIAAAITEVAGSSAWFNQSVVSYANMAKTEMLGVGPDLLEAHGAVSKEVVLAMAEGARAAANATFAVAVSGVAGPSGGSFEKPVGTVWVAWAGSAIASEAEVYAFAGDRSAVREAALIESLHGTIRRVKKACVSAD